MALHDEILDELRGYLDGRHSVGAFEEWFFPAIWNVHKSGDALADRLSGKIALFLAEFDRGHRTEPELKRLLQQILDDTRVPVPGSTNPDA